MFNKRSFLLGLGAGIIIGAVLLELFYLGQNSQQRLNEITRQIEQGNEDDGGIPSSGDETGLEAAEEEAAPSLFEPSTAPEEPEATITEAGEEALPEGGRIEPGRERIVRIEPGTGVTEAARLLAEQAVIDDIDAFIAQMKASGKQVRAGYFLTEERIGVEAAIALVTSTPLTGKQLEEHQARLDAPGVQ